jgi:CBS-domain-containing membrane protein
MSDRPGTTALAGRLQRPAVGAAYGGLLGLAVLCVSGVVGLGLHQPWLFPSLGPTVMIFFESPSSPAARPHAALVGHGVGLVVGYLCLLAFGLTNAPSVVQGGLTVPHVLAGALSVALTTVVLTLLKLQHPPAGATTLIVSLGILHQPPQLLAMAGAIVLITVLGFALNRLLLGRQPTAT